MKITSIAMLLWLLVFASCDNEVDPKPDPQPTKTELITAVKWELKSVGGATPFQVAVFEFEPDGEFDYTLTGQGTSSSGTGVWKWDLNETEIDMTYQGGGKYEGKLNKLTSDELRLVWGSDNGKESLYKPKQ